MRPGPAAGTTRIAMWSGPRTVSTALMRAWENRPDTAVVDEPLYAFYLDRTGIDNLFLVRERKTTHGKADDGNDNENGSEYCCGLHRQVTFLASTSILALIS